MFEIILKMQEKYPLPFSLLDELLTIHLHILRDSIFEHESDVGERHRIHKARISGYVIGILESYLRSHPEIRISALDILDSLQELVQNSIAEFEDKFPI